MSEKRTTPDRIARILAGLIKPYQMTMTDTDPCRYDTRENAVSIQIFDPLNSTPGHREDGEKTTVEIIDRLAASGYAPRRTDEGKLIVRM